MWAAILCFASNGALNVCSASSSVVFHGLKPKLPISLKLDWAFMRGPNSHSHGLLFLFLAQKLYLSNDVTYKLAFLWLTFI